MRAPYVIIFVLLLFGCKSSERNAQLTATQAQELALRLANDKADGLFHHRPFQNDQPASFVEGRWIWTDSHGVGLTDLRATVELAANGSTNSVDVKIFDDALRPRIPEQTR
jgi:hypothetical protein